MQIGIRGKQEMTVTADKTAAAIGSGELAVLATPAMIALMEETAWKSVAGELEPGTGTVGTDLQRGKAGGVRAGRRYHRHHRHHGLVRLGRKAEGSAVMCGYLRCGYEAAD